MSPADRIAVGDIRDACSRVTAFVGTMDGQDFIADLKSQSAVAYRLIVIGEATKRLSKAFRLANPPVDRRAMAGMRDILVHDYHKLDVSILWRSASLSVPALCLAVSRLLDGP
ncbi:DUF86 domain-containing protein [Skermanella rosea]|uniref:HepT-like ribonuclease domain-containing protein n=1 Tax=Skermanella rosea TaxID=1817965 RepID=UPI001931F918|nr:HepT-like ribonuclease domain-containing protein [Skermanella rosea]UEM04793.1 DUF86 domain-containing protein [Skermanella rosea]